MNRLCVCREYEGMFTEGFKYVESLEKHDAKVRADAIEEFKQLFWKSKVEFRPSQIDEILRMLEQLKEQI